MTTKDLIEFNELKAEITALIAPGLAMEVTDFQSAARVTEAAKQIKAMEKRVEARRKELVEPLNIQVKKINQYAKDVAGPLEEVEAHFKSQIRAFEIEQEKVREAERRKAEEEARRKAEELRVKQEAERAEREAELARQAAALDVLGPDDDEGLVDIEAEHQAFEEKQLQEQALLRTEAAQREWDIKQQGVKNVAKVWKCEVVDIDKVPVQYLKRELNKAFVLASARAGVTEIPGVKLWKDVEVKIGVNTYVPRVALTGETT